VEFKEARAQELRDILEGIQIGGIGRRDLVEFSTNMGVMVKAGVPLMTGLSELREDIDSAYFKRVLGQMIEDIQGGDNLYVAMSNQPKVFPELYVNVIQIGENTGGLDTAFFDLARHYKRIDDLIRNVRKAMIYPAFVVIALIGRRNGLSHPGLPPPLHAAPRIRSAPSHRDQSGDGYFTRFTGSLAGSPRVCRCFCDHLFHAEKI